MTDSVDIICDFCDARMRLSPQLLEQLSGRAGRITCRKCHHKVGLDGSGEFLRVTGGGRLVAPETFEEDDEDPPVSTNDPHLSEFPPGIKVSLPPPLSNELKERRRMKALAALVPQDTSESSDRQSEPDALGLSTTPEKSEPTLPMVAPLAAPPADLETTASIPKAPPAPRAAPPAPIRSSEGSLSPHTMDDEEDDEEMIPTARAPRSTPHVSERDATYQSLYSENRAPKGDSQAPQSTATLSPMVDGNAVALGTGRPPQVAAPVVERGEVAEKKRRGAGWLPWAIAAAALFALGISLSFQFAGSTYAEDLLQQGQEPQLAALSTESTNQDISLDVPEPPAVELEPLPGEDGVELAALEASQAKRAPKPVAASSAKRAQLAAKMVHSAPKATAPAEPAIAEEDAAPAEEPKEAVIPPFSTSAASAAIRQAAAVASSCRSADDPTGVAQVEVTFVPSGKVTQATISGPPFAGTPTGSCIAARFRSARVPEFSGQRVTVMKTVTIR